MVHANALRRLNCVFAAVDHGSLRQAARALGMRESSVSRSIIALEQSLNIQLFDRSVRGVRLTEAGKRWAGIARAHFEGLNDALSAGHRSDGTELRVGVSALAGRGFLARLVRRFGKLNPSVNVVIEDIAREQGVSAIRRRQLDILFTRAGAATFCSMEIVGRERLFVLLPDHHRLAAASAVSWSDLQNECIFVPCVSDLAASDFPLHGDFARRPRISAASVATAILQVQLGRGVSVAEEAFARSASPELTTWRPLKGKDSVCPINAIWLESNPKRALLRLLGIARKLAAETLDTMT